MEPSSSPATPSPQNDPRAPLLGRYHSESDQYKVVQPSTCQTIQSGTSSTCIKTPVGRHNSAGSECDHRQQSVVIRTYLWRWVVLAIFFLNLGINNSVWITIAPVADVMRCYYGISNTWVNTTTTVYMATYVLFFLPCAWILDRYGLRVTVILASLVNALGTAVRVAGTGKIPYNACSEAFTSIQFMPCTLYLLCSGFRGAGITHIRTRHAYCMHAFA